MPVEEIIDPERPICDPHHHLWNRPLDQPSGVLGLNKAHYLVPEFLADALTGHNIVSTVFLECAAFYRREGPAQFRPLGETHVVASITGNCRDPRVAAAIVGHVDLTGDQADAVLEAQVAAGQGRFRGIRQMAARDPLGSVQVTHATPEGLYGSDAFRAGFAHLARHGLRFDAWVFHMQIGEVAELARAFPDQPILLDHLATPLGIGAYAGRRDEVFAVWREGMRALAACDNASIKIGGLAMPHLGFDLDRQSTSAEWAEAWRPWVETAIELFGPARAMFESNFPIDWAGADYATLWNAFKRLTAGYSDDEKDALFRGTAERYYGIS